MNFLPRSTCPIDQFVFGEVARIETVGERSMFLSVVANENEAEIRPFAHPASDANLSKFQFTYPSGSFLDLQLRLKRSYLFALADNSCVGFLQLRGNDEVLIPGGVMPIRHFVERYLGQAFPDYYGFRSNVEGPER